MTLMLAMLPDGGGGSPRRSGNGTLQQVDLWTKWWSRLSQVVGLALAGYEIVLRHGGAQDGVLIFCAASMLGPVGLRIFVRGVADAARRADHELGKAQEGARPDDAP